MLYRAAILGIVAFWLVMMASLVRLEVHPERTNILDVPVGYVTRILFSHGQQSLLTVNDGVKAVGTISVRPMVSGSDSRRVTASGSLAVPQRFSFKGTFDMDAALKFRDFHLEISIRKPRCQIVADGDAAHNRMVYEVQPDDQPPITRTLPMDSGFGSSLAQSLGFDPQALPVATENLREPEIAARETQISLHGEQEEVYEVIIGDASAPLLEFYVTQLGQVILAKTSFGYTLSAEDWE